MIISSSITVDWMLTNSSSTSSSNDQLVWTQKYQETRFYIIYINIFSIYFRIFLFSCDILHCVCLVSVECKIHYGNKKMTPVWLLFSAPFYNIFSVRDNVL